MYFSVIIPTLNSPVIHKTIEALENQRFDRQNYEVIIVGMDTLRLVQESDLVNFDRSDHPLSPAQARNRGAKKAHGDILAFTDADGVPNLDWLAVLADCFSDPDISVLGGSIAFDKNNYWTVSDNLAVFHEYLNIHPPGTRMLLPTLNLALRRSAFEEVGGFDERYPRPAGEDADLAIRLRKKGHILNFEPRAIVKHIPSRSRFCDVMRHSYYQGMYSTKVDQRYVSEGGLAGIFNTRFGILLFAPLLAAGVTARIYKDSHLLRQYWNSLPTVFLAKLTWCIGAANHPQW